MLKHSSLLRAEEGYKKKKTKTKLCFLESKTQMTKEDKRRMHTSRSAMCSIQTVKYLHIPHTPRAPRTSLVVLRKRKLQSKPCHYVALQLSYCHKYQFDKFSFRPVHPPHSLFTQCVKSQNTSLSPFPTNLVV